MSKSGENLKNTMGSIHEEEEVGEKSKEGELGKGFVAFSRMDMEEVEDQFGDGFE